MISINRGGLGAIGREAGKYALQNKFRLVIDDINKENISTDIEKEISKFYESHLKGIIDLPVITEENFQINSNLGESEYWLVDSIDGTLSYINGFLSYVTQFALIRNGSVIYGLVYAPEFDVLYEGIYHYGAFKNGVKLKSDNQAQVRTIIDNTPTPSLFIGNLMKDFEITNYVVSGSIGLKLCKVADGQADIFVKKNSLETWDVAPGSLILQEAGGLACNIDGSNFILEVGKRTRGVLGIGNGRRDLVEAINARAEGLV